MLRAALMLFVLVGCTRDTSKIGSTGSPPTPAIEPPKSGIDSPSSSDTATASPRADVVGVRIESNFGAATMYVTIRSDETGCDRYADWWEVLDTDGALLYRRILTHSHPDEQPFERSGGPVPISETDEVVVRAHLAPGGYGGELMGGSAKNGFTAVEREVDWAQDVEVLPPQPDDCLF